MHHLATIRHHRPSECTIIACHVEPLVPSFTPAIPLTMGDLLTYRDAFRFARRAHAGQKRADGRAFVSHPLAVLQILRSVSDALPHAAYVTALLHDTVEDGQATEKDVRTAFGDETAEAVAALTRPDRPRGTSVPAHERAYLNRMADVHARLPYVLHVKMADRLHNLETAHVLASARRQALLHETATLYLPMLQEHASLSAAHTDAFAILLTMLEESVARMTERAVHPE